MSIMDSSLAERLLVARLTRLLVDEEKNKVELIMGKYGFEAAQEFFWSLLRDNHGEAMQEVIRKTKSEAVLLDRKLVAKDLLVAKDQVKPSTPYFSGRKKTVAKQFSKVAQPMMETLLVLHLLKSLESHIPYEEMEILNEELRSIEKSRRLLVLRKYVEQRSGKRWKYLLEQAKKSVEDMVFETMVNTIDEVRVTDGK